MSTAKIDLPGQERGGRLHWAGIRAAILIMLQMQSRSPVWRAVQQSAFGVTAPGKRNGVHELRAVSEEQVCCACDGVVISSRDSSSITGKKGFIATAILCLPFFVLSV